MKTEAARCAEAATRFAVIGRANSTGRIFHHGQPMPLGQLQDRIHVSRDPEGMHRYDGLGARGDLFRQVVVINVEGLKVNIDEHRPGPLLYHHVGRSRESKVWYQDLIPWTYVQCNEG